MRKVILLALLAVAFVAMPAFASVQNVKVSGSVNSSWIVRDQFDLGDRTIAENYYQNFLITQAILRVDANLTDKVDATVSLINERAWGDEGNDIDSTGTSTDTSEGANDVDIHLAFVKIREMLYSPLTVYIGRQVFAYGNSFVIDATGTNNSTSAGGLDGVAEDMTMRSALDAVRMVFDYNPLTIDVVAAKIDQGNLGGTGLHDDDIDLFGANANYKLGDKWDTTVEGYFWAKIDQSTKGGSPGFGLKPDTVYMPGAHVSTNPVKGLNLQAEGAIQRGNKAITASNPDNVIREAIGGQVVANYMLPFEKTAKWSPVVTGVYTYVSGDSNPNENGNNAGDQHYTAWDPMLENQGGGNIYNTLFDLSNAHIALLKAQVKPMEDVTTSVEFTRMWLDKEIAGAGQSFVGNCSGSSCFVLKQPDGSTTNPRVTTNKHIGDEVGLAAVYQYTEDVSFGAKANYFMPGRMFHKDNSNNASQYIVNANVNF